jgi:cyclic-di-AMP phosphodiesterase PgpH
MKEPGAGRPSLLPRARAWMVRRPTFARFLILLPLLLAGITLFPPQFGRGALRLRLGERAPRTVIADFEFPVWKDPSSLERERTVSASESPIAVDLADSISRRSFAEFGEFRGMITKVRSGARHKTLDPELKLNETLLVWLMLAKDPQPTFEQAESLLQDAFDRGLVEEQVEPMLRGGAQIQVRDAQGVRLLGADQVQSPSRLREVARNRALARGLEPAPLEELVARFAHPNLIYNLEGTEDLRDSAREGVDPVALRVMQGERIAVAGERITPEILSKLESYDHWRAQREIGTPWVRIGGWVGRLLLLLIAVGSFAMYLKFLRPEIYVRLGDLALLSYTCAAVMGLSGLFLHLLDLPTLMAPVAAAPILVAMLFDERLALVVGLALTGLIGLIAEMGAPTMSVLGVGAVTAIFCVRGLRHRREFYRLVIYVPAAHLVTLVALALAHSQAPNDLLRDAIAAALNPILTAGLAIFVIPLAEHTFRKCSDITLLELSDLNRPLLRRLMVEAPGTYHHSLMVGTLAETAARVGGGNPLLARVIGYYHDIGKIAKPSYFIENIQAGRRNPHDKLSPSMSRLILESHVREGVTLAAREDLPHVVVEGVRQHHGNSLMAFFWHKARRQDNAAREEEYRYPGPRPQFREAALVMIADQVDAAARALEDPTPSRIKGVVVKVLETRLADGDLDDSELTLSDLARIRDALVPVLAAFFHARTAYQGPEEDAKRITAARDRESPAKSATPQG